MPIPLMPHPPTRRDFVARTAAAVAAANVPFVPRQQEPLTVRALVDRIREKTGVPWRDKTLDGLKAGSPDTVVTGVATTVMPTVDVLRRAAAARANLVIVQDPTFYAANDEPGNRATDTVYLAKKALVDERRLVIWRFSDHWHARQPSPSVTALAAALGWTARDGSGGLFALPETTLGSLVGHLRSRLRLSGGLRVVGPSDMRVRTAVLAPGTIDLAAATESVPQADVMIAGEPREWEGVPYVLDSRAAGQAKAMVALGRIASLEPSAGACAEWIRSFTPEVPIQALTIGDPYWNPSA